MASVSEQTPSFSTSRGALLLTVSQGIAIFVGFAIHVGLTRLLSLL